MADKPGMDAFDARREALTAFMVPPDDAPGTYTVMVKVIDILGNDTKKAIEVEVR